MHRYFLFVYSIYTTPVVADFLGPSYPAPTDLSSEQSLVSASWQNAFQTLQHLIDGTTNSSFVTDIQNLTFSLGMFSLFDDNVTALQFHHTIYRIASITKVFTVLAGLFELNLTDWERSLPELIPTLAQFVGKASGKHNPIELVDWEKITPSSLAAQIAGVPRDGFPAPGELTEAVLTGVVTSDELVQLGFPPIADNDTTEYPPCTPFLFNGTTCPPGPFIEGVEVSTPTFLPWTTPGYSDAGFAMLGLAIASIQ